MQLRFVVVQSISHVWLFVTPWTAACHASLSLTISWSLPIEFMSNESLMPSNHIILCHPLLLLLSIFPQVFSNEWVLWIRWSKYQSFSISPSNEYSGLISLRCKWLISLQSKELSRVFSRTTIWKHQFFSAQPSLLSNSHIRMTTGKIIALTIWTLVSKVMSLFLICCLGLSWPSFQEASVFSFHGCSHHSLWF